MSDSDYQRQIELRHAIDLPDSPYPGLRAFRLNEWPIFFGRERMVDDVIDRIGASQFVMIHGASGSGKSSLIRAGVIAQLQREHANRGLDWLPATMLPGSSPMWHFAVALVSALTGRDVPDRSEIAQTRLRLNRGANGVAEVLQKFGFGDRRRLFILVDQFEEIFRFAKEGRENEREAAAFVRLLVDLHNRCPDNVYVALTMRSDHLGDCSHFVGFAEIVNATQYLVPSMDEVELEDAIRQPAVIYKGSVDRALAEKLIRDTRHSPDQLPLIQHAIAYMWVLKKQRKPSQAPNLSCDFLSDKAVGSVTMALSNHADAVLDQLAPQREGARDMAERVFRGLTQIDNSGRAIRRRRGRQELLEEIGGSEKLLNLVIDAYAGKDLLIVEEADPERDPKIDISHEALIRHWTALNDQKLDENGHPKGWVAREDRDGRIWQSLVATVESAKESKEVYLSKAVYESRQAWWKARKPTSAWAEGHGNQFERIQALFARSCKRIEEEERAEAERKAAIDAARKRELAYAQALAQEQSQRARLFKRLTGALAVALIVVVVSAWIAVYFYVVQKDTSDRLQISLENEQTERSKAEALTATLNQILAAGIDELKNDPGTMALATRLEDQVKGAIEPPAPIKLTPEEWQVNLKDLRDLIEAHNDVLKKLSLGGLLNDEITTETVKNFRQLYDKLKRLNQLRPFFDETSSIRKDFEGLEARIQRLEDIRGQGDPESLGEISETAEHMEAAYAAWTRLGELSGHAWPAKDEDWKRDRRIRARLKDEFAAIGRQDEITGKSLLRKLAETGLQRETVFIKLKNSSGDKVLDGFCALADVGGRHDNPDGFQDLKDLAVRLADFVSKTNWPGEFNMNPPSEENPLYHKTELRKTDFEKWLNEAEDYRRLEPDPREKYRDEQRKTVQNINSLIARVTPNLPTKATEFQQALDPNADRILELLKKPAIAKYEIEIRDAADELASIWEQLATLTEEVRSHIFDPDYARVSIVPDGPTGWLRVGLESRQLDDKFVPLSASDRQPIAVARVSQAELVREDFVEEKYCRDNPLNAGWPKYIASIRDPDVMLRFIPAGDGNSEPFYMATHEITYTQYVHFLREYEVNETKPGPVGYPRQNKFGIKGKAFISWTGIDYPRCPIQPTGQTFEIDSNDPQRGYPVTYVTYHGAQSYADWFGAQLPDSEQHRYACRAGTTTVYPWGENRSDALGYAHVRAEPWRKAAETYNKDKDRLRALAKLPIGAVKSDNDYVNDPKPGKRKGLISNRVVAEENPPYANRSVWPVASSTASNGWGLYDMIGNVWEWCKDESICGGSCLAQPEHITTQRSMYSVSFSLAPLQAKAKDVGFRVVVPAM